jgi:hypothetical protein
MTTDTANGKPWKLVNLKVPHDVLKRIDREAERLRLSRTQYMLGQADPKRRERVA